MDEQIATIVARLATPLTSIRGYTGLLSGGEFGPLSQEQEEALQIIARNIERLSVVLRELDALAKEK